MLVGLALLAMPVLLVVALVSLSSLKGRVAALEGALAELRLATARPAPARARDEAARPPADAPAAGVGPAQDDAAPTLSELMRTQPPARPVSAASSPASSVHAPAMHEPAVHQPAASSAGQPSDTGSAPPAGGAATGAAASTPPPLPPPPNARPWREDAPGTPDTGAALLRTVKRWFTVGNVPVKIGMLVLLAGVAALLKYASDQGLFSLPLELRLAGVAAVALAALAFAWRRRQSNRVFALSLQGGAIGVLLLTVYAAFKLYGVLPAGAAFALSGLLVAGMGLLAVLQDAKALAVFALLAGFLAPLWLSTGSGNHVALFSYYALLNAAIVAIAWFRAWRILNLLGFVFTFGIGTLWGVYDYRPEQYASTQPFLALFFAFYLLVPILFARRQPEGRRDFIDGCLVFGTPLVAFALQAGLMEGVLADGDRLPLALCALGLGVLYAGLAWALLRRAGYAVLGQSHAILAVGFATLAVPLALSARATASAFALEGAGLFWLGLRQGRGLPQFAGAALQLLAACALLAGLLDHAGGDARPLFNPTAMGALLIALAGLASAWAARAHGMTGSALAFYLWGLAWWSGNGVHEIDRFVAADARPDALLAFAAASGWIAAEVHRWRPARALAATVFAAFALAMPLALWQDAVHAHPFGGGWGAAAWALFAVLGLRSLWCLRDDDDGGTAGLAQFAWWLLWPLSLSLWASWLATDAGLAQGWRVALLALPWLALAALALRRWPWLAFPRDAGAVAGLRTPLLGVVFALIATGWLLALALAASPAPLPWLPLLNPAELAQLIALALAAVWLWSAHSPATLSQLRTGVVALGGFLLLSASTLRSVHHWGGIDWNPELLSTSLAQTSLTVVWSVLGVIGWIVGSRRGRRGLWLAGAVLMGVVLAKLLLVDRQHLGGVLGIVSFIAYGVLCTIVGYLAPAPPRTHDDPLEEGRT
ncbi:membrane protein [Pseudoxanthomonas suwonensis]|uniref:Membrane protein n=1 Tax=Pseudoxanthomonas suwonensis TaxID=314722 RepID=A0A0E3Z4W3_9GAMM|nr:membrane protein [Pseudoxanthomonas suwonensis]